MGKTVIGIILGILAGIIIVLVGIVAAGYFFGLSFFNGQASNKQALAPSPSLSSPLFSPTPTKPTSPSPTLVTPSATAASPTPTQASANVNFALNITSITGTGLTRTVAAQITNTGTADAHNAWAKVEVSSGSSIIKVNGQDNIRVDIGTIKAGQTITKQVDLTFSVLDGLAVSQQGAHFSLTINSDERTQTLTYDYKP